jgi:hypothetical protein
MENSTVQKVNQEIYHRYPEFTGVRPDIQSAPATAGAQAAGYLLTYKVQAVSANDRKITRLLRVTVSAQGKIVKISTSR